MRIKGLDVRESAGALARPTLLGWLIGALPVALLAAMQDGAWRVGGPLVGVVLCLVAGLVTSGLVGAGLGATYGASRLAVQAGARAGRQSARGGHGMAPAYRPQQGPQTIMGAFGVQTPPTQPPPLTPERQAEADQRLAEHLKTSAAHTQAAADKVRRGASPLAPLSDPPVRPKRTAPVELGDPQRVNKVLAKLDSKPGMEEVAAQVREMAQRMQLDAKRRAAGMRVGEVGMHAVFTGPPGTGKTTVARIWGEILAAVGLLPSGHVVETDRSGLVGGYVGKTAEITAAKLDEARGGVLFVDEAYTLTSSGSPQDFGPEAVTTILARMENERTSLCVIVAGYDREMAAFLATNPGLKSRFSRTVDFPHYDAPTLVDIAQAMAQDDDDTFTPQAEEALLTMLTRLTANRPPDWANARSVRSILDAARTARAARLGRTGREPTVQDMATLTEDDVVAAVARLHPQAR